MIRVENVATLNVLWSLNIKEGEKLTKLTFLPIKYYCVHEKVMWFVVFEDINNDLMV